MENFLVKYIFFFLFLSLTFLFIESSSIGTSAGSMSSNRFFESSSSEATSSEDACKICLDSEANCAFIECGHIVSCINCAKSLTLCPVCRAVIKRTLRVYKS